MKEGYKKTELGWIPKEWDIIPLIEGTTLIKDGTHNPPKRTDVGIPLLSAENIFNGKVNYGLNEKSISIEDFKQMHKNYKIEKGDVLMTIVGTIGRVAVVDSDREFAVQRSVAIIKSNAKLNNKFLAKFLESDICQNQLSKRSNSTAQAGLYLGELSKVKIPLPDIREQEKIAEILSIIDLQIYDTDTLIEKIKRLKNGLIQRLLTNGIKHTEFKKTEIGDIPVEWDIKEVGGITSFVGSGITPKGGQKVYLDDGIAFIRSQNVLVNKLSTEDIAYISEEINEKMKRTEVFNGDVLLNITGASIGRCALVPNGFGRGNVNQHVCILRLNQGHGEYLVQVMNSKVVKDQIDSFNGGSSREGLNFQQVRHIQVPYPPLEEQKQIANILSSLDNNIEGYENKKNKLEEVKKGIMQQLLTGKVRVV
ncbi:restriction endonuclease subunit S [Candidatus Clostridium radicumherbarum]|uniref:Restriction endonuclease subunit S n=1 Tax=Candidatus Clostridium radicumherbarum TaxID=3381662 RepID=A0ABW8TX63_9CLOT